MGLSKFPSLQCCSNCCVDDHSRVVLQDSDDNTSGYINANYIDVSPQYTSHRVAFAHLTLYNNKVTVVLYCARG